MSFNPLDRGNLYLIRHLELDQQRVGYCFNPLDRGNLYLIVSTITYENIDNNIVFQSPRSGKFVSNPMANKPEPKIKQLVFQSPRSGKFVSNKS